MVTSWLTAVVTSIALTGTQAPTTYTTTNQNNNVKSQSTTNYAVRASVGKKDSLEDTNLDVTVNNEKLS